jgi:ATP-binding cassette subfamily B protein
MNGSRAPAPDEKARAAKGNAGRGHGIASDDTAGKFLDTYLVRRLWPFIRPHSRLLLASILLLPLATLFDIARPTLFKLAIDEGILAKDESALTLYAGIFVLSLFLGFGLAFAQNALMILAGLRSTHDIRNAAFRHLLSLRQGFFDRQLVGRLLTRVTGDIESLNEAFAAGVFSLLGDGLVLLSIAAVLLYYDPWLALVTFASAPILLLSGSVFRDLSRNTFRDIRGRTARINSFLKEHVTGMPLVQAFQQEGRAAQRFDQDNLAYREATSRSFLYDAVLFAWVEALSSIFLGGILWIAAGRLENGAISFGILTAFIQYLDRFFTPLRELATKFTTMQSAFAAAEKIVSLLDEDQVLPEGNKPAKFEDALRFEGVTFTYGDGAPALTDVSFSLPRGKKIALVGATGSGKSTIVRLLLRQHDATAGRIALDGNDIREISKEDYRRLFAVVLQDVFLFSGTVGENLSLFDAELPKERIDAAVKAVQAEDIIKRLSGGYEAKVLERGGNFSQGERQLLAFARALAHDPQVLVLDEATASVDSVTEERLQKALDVLLEGRSAVVVAHRLSTIQKCDEILVIHQGKLAEQGTHQELLAKNGLYAKLYRLQFAHK